MVAEYERSGLTRRGFSEQSGIAVSTLDYWRRQVRDRERARILPVKLEADRENGDRIEHGGFRLSLPNGVEIESGWEFRERDLARLLRVAAER